jgi:hydrogenase maturation protease
MNPTAIICLGNRFAPGDDIGCRLYDHLASTPLPEEIDLIDGGLCGIDLLHVIEGRRRVIFADAVTGMAAADAIIVLGRAEVAAYAQSYGHGAGLPYLLRLLPHVCPAPLPEIALVGMENPARATPPAADAAVRALAARCMEIAVHGLS